MEVKELISKLRQPYKIEIREDNYFLCETATNNKVIELFYERKIIDWFPIEKGLGCMVALVVNVTSEESGDNYE